MVTKPLIWVDGAKSKVEILFAFLGGSQMAGCPAMYYQRKVQTRVMLGYLCTYIGETIRSMYDRYAANRADPGSGIV